MKAGRLTDEQHYVLCCVYEATVLDVWYRARSNGERVTLASLHRRGLVTRQAWRGAEGHTNSAYEYQLSKVVLEELQKLSRRRW